MKLTNCIRTNILSFALLVAAAAHAGAQAEFKLLASDGAEYDSFGQSVSVDGNTAVMGAYGNDDNGFNSGSAYVFVRSGTTWTEQAKLLPGDGAPGDFLGRSVSVSGDTAVVGAPQDGDNGIESGSAYVFVRNGTNWMQQAKLLPSDGAPGDYFGGSVSVSTDTVVVGAYTDDDNGDASGSAYVFVRNGITWAQQAKLLPSDGAAGDICDSVAVSVDTVVVGAFGDDDNGFISGSAYVFVSNGTNWTQYAKLLPSDGASGP